MDDRTEPVSRRPNRYWRVFVVGVLLLLLPGAIVGVMRLRAFRAVYLLERLLRDGWGPGSPENQVVAATDEVENAGATREAIELIRKYLNKRTSRCKGCAEYALSVLQGDRRTAIPEVLVLFRDPKIASADRLFYAQLIAEIAPEMAEECGATAVINADRERQMKRDQALEKFRWRNQPHVQVPDEVFEKE